MKLLNERTILWKAYYWLGLKAYCVEGMLKLVMLGNKKQDWKLNVNPKIGSKGISPTIKFFLTSNPPFMLFNCFSENNLSSDF